MKDTQERIEALDELLKSDGVPAITTISQAAKAMSASQDSVRRAVNAGKLPSLSARCAPSTGKKRGKRIVRISRRELARFLIEGGSGHGKVEE